MTTRLRLMIAAFSVAALVLTGCSGDDDDSGVASLSTDTSADSSDSGGGGDSSSSDDDVEAEVLAYVECLRGQGLDVPDPEVDADGNLSLGGPGAGGGAGDVPQIDADQFEAAQEVCGDPPEGVGGGFTEDDQSAFQDAALEFAQCMRDEGIDVADPDFSQGFGPGAGGGAGGPFGDLDIDDPAVQAALEVCQQVFADSGIGQPGNAT